MITPEEQFELEINNRISKYKSDADLMMSVREYAKQITRVKHAYNFYWLGRPIIQGPTDLQVYQEIIWKVKPDLIIETGIAWGGSLIFSASMLALLEYCKEIDHGQVVGVDIDIREHNMKAIGAHPLSKKITLLQGSSIAPEVIEQVHSIAKGKNKILVILDSNHTHDHVLAELRAYGPLVTKGSYCIVNDTGIEDIEIAPLESRPWGKGNNPKTAILDYLKEDCSFKIDHFYESKALVTSANDGFLLKL